ncbi:restriction endonuclease subunit S [Microcoleus sp. F8-D3]
MNRDWSLTSLGKVIKYRKEFIEIDDTQKYKRCRVQCHAKGVVLRDIVQGSEIKTKKQQPCRTGEFLIAEIDAKMGGFGIVPESLDGAIVSSHYFLFEINEQLLDRSFFNFFIRTPFFFEQVAAQGSTNYAAIRPQEVLTYQIPLPPLDEQRRIVARIEELAAKVEEARGLRRQSAEEAEVLINSAIILIFEKQILKQGWNLQPLREGAEISRGKFAYRPRNEPRFYGGNIPFIQIGDISKSNRYIQEYSQTLNQDGLKISRMFPKGTVVLAITGATIGVTGILGFDSCFPDSIVGITPHPNITISEFIYWSIEYVKKIALSEATQTTQPNINLKNIEKLKIPVPPLPEQHRIVAYLDDLQTKVDALKRLQTETAAELDALVPSILDKAFKGEL